jgi:DNA-directed RNA polymerase specialized sigma24 family protein
VSRQFGKFREASVSFEEFVQACSPRLFRTALLLAAQDRATAEDLLQLALERAYRHWGTCPPFG